MANRARSIGVFFMFLICLTGCSRDLTESKAASLISATDYIQKPSYTEHFDFGDHCRVLDSTFLNSRGYMLDSVRNRRFSALVESGLIRFDTTDVTLAVESGQAPPLCTSATTVKADFSLDSYRGPRYYHIVSIGVTPEGLKSGISTFGDVVYTQRHFRAITTLRKLTAKTVEADFEYDWEASPALRKAKMNLVADSGRGIAGFTLSDNGWQISKIADVPRSHK